ncbi:MAG: hypothetical protein EOS28_18440 [Mesorhizobium sp.]|nr:MAG: hypothetical protein EOS28_18440 [Mesorhizobium sp.]
MVYFQRQNDTPSGFAFFPMLLALAVEAPLALDALLWRADWSTPATSLRRDVIRWRVPQHSHVSRKNT